jgi:DNA-binding MarR family transcriptional regulator
VLNLSNAGRDAWVTATVQALGELDGSFFRVRFDRLTPTEKRYLRAMAELGPGPYRSGDIAEKLGKRVTAMAPVRNSLINKGMVYSRSHGDTAFTVPLFDGFMHRVMPDVIP